MPFIVTVARTVFIEAVRNRLVGLAAIVIGVGFGLTQFLNQVAITESNQIQVALLAALLRVAAVFIVVTLIVTSMVREANDKVTELLLSLPAPRIGYFLGKFIGYSMVALALTLAFAVPLTPFAPLAGVTSWAISLCCELLVMSAMSLFCVLSLTQVPSAVAAAVGFYVLARSTSAMQVIAAASLATELSFADRAVSWIVNAIALVLPDLGRMTQTAWLVADPPGPMDLGSVLAQSAIYVVLISSAALFDLYRRNY